MLGPAAAILLCLLPSQVNALITSAAICLPGYDWMFSSINQSPCDVAEELMSVCYGTYPLPPLPVGYTYAGPYLGYGNSCSCCSVTYSLLSACAICQGRTYHWFSDYATNCTTVSISEFKPQIPIGVKVPAYAYQDVSTSDAFNATLAQRQRGPDSTRLPSSSTSSYSSSTPSISVSGNVITPSSISSNGGGATVNNTPAIVGGVVGGVVGIGLIIALILFLRRRPKQDYQNFNSSIQSPFIANTTTGSSMPPGSPVKVETAYPSAAYDAHRQQSPPLTLEQNMTGLTEKSAPSQNYVPPRNGDGRLGYSGMPEV